MSTRQSCLNHQNDILQLDAFKELVPEERPDWDAHLAECSGCRHEQERIHQLMAAAKAATPQIPPSVQAQLQRAVRDQVRRSRPAQEKAGTALDRSLSGRFRGWGFPRIFAPTLAAAALLLGLVGVGLFGLWENPEQPIAVKAQDVEVIENLELLQEMDVLKKLVQKVDARGEIIETDDPRLKSLREFGGSDGTVSV